MKRNITVEQINSLALEERNKLLKWWKPEAGDKITVQASQTPQTKGWFEGFYKYKNAAGLFCDLEKPSPVCGYFPWILPLLSIDQMIDFLQKGLDEIKQVSDGPTFGSAIPKWQVLFDMDKFKGKGINVNTLYNYIEVELCDALFEGVKKVLKEDEQSKKQKQATIQKLG